MRKKCPFLRNENVTNGEIVESEIKSNILKKEILVRSKFKDAEKAIKCMLIERKYVNI